MYVVAEQSLNQEKKWAVYAMMMMASPNVLFSGQLAAVFDLPAGGERRGRARTRKSDRREWTVIVLEVSRRFPPLPPRAIFPPPKLASAWPRKSGRIELFLGHVFFFCI
jgi:hypothetical protein